MIDVIIVENEEDEVTLHDHGLVGERDVLVYTLNEAPSALRSLQMDGYNALFLVQTTSIEDKFFKSWLADVSSIANTDQIRAVAPSLLSACKDERWVARLRHTLDGQNNQVEP